MAAWEAESMPRRQREMSYTLDDRVIEPKECDGIEIELSLETR